ncbi:MAG: c-type cytochrome [Candidatus Rokubacteria bacterium]|nr:c-type cytochrome [Candidatus Rokubacteria bacterium]
MKDTDTHEPDRLLDHEYDGICEYDNPLPGWWVWLFVATVAFSAGYYAWYQLGPGPTIIAQYEAEVREAAEHQAPAGAVAATEDALKRLQRDTTVMAGARETFATRCAACHGPEGQGLIGPNLVDEFWLHGGTLTTILRTVAEGVPDKGMVPWKGQLTPAELEAIAAYIGTLRGTNPPNPKPPQGAKVTGA